MYVSPTFFLLLKDILVRSASGCTEILAICRQKSTCRSEDGREPPPRYTLRQLYLFRVSIGLGKRQSRHRGAETSTPFEFAILWAGQLSSGGQWLVIIVSKVVYTQTRETRVGDAAPPSDSACENTGQTHVGCCRCIHHHISEITSRKNSILHCLYMHCIYRLVTSSRLSCC